MNDKSGEEEVFRASPILLVPVAASLVVSVLCASLILMSGTDFLSVTLFSDVGFGPFINATIFVALTGIGASMIYLLLRRKRLWVIRVLICFAVTVVTFFLSDFYLWMLFSLLNVADVELLAFLNAVLVTVIVDVEFFVLDNVGYEIIVLTLGGALGTFLGASIPTFSAVFILLFLGIYDIFAVTRGPVGKIALEGLRHLRGLSFSFRDIQMGLGDVTFYSMLISHAFIFFGPWACLSSTIGVLAGSLISFKMLEKKSIFPGLPFSVFLGLLGVFLVVALQYF